MVFDEKYADAYDVLYQDKNYEKECDFLEALFEKYNYKPKTILDLGCGTGGHAIILAKRGYKVTGIDQSKHMLKIAGHKAKEAGVDIEFIKTDITNATIKRKYDAVIAPLLHNGESEEKSIERIIRLTIPEIDIVKHTVYINFKTIRTKGNIFEENCETHPMRFIFPQEIKYFLEVGEFKKVDFYPFLEVNRALTDKDWNIVVVGRT